VAEGEAEGSIVGSGDELGEGVIMVGVIQEPAG